MRTAKIIPAIISVLPPGARAEDPTSACRCRERMSLTAPTATRVGLCLLASHSETSMTTAA